MLKGIFSPVTTPFVNDEVVYDKLASNIKKWNGTNLAGYVVMGSNGESAFLTRSEKLKIVEEVRRNTPQEKLVIAGTGSDSIRETISLTNNSAKNGADYALVLTPSFFKEKMTDESFVNYFTGVADNADIPVIIYNVPKYTGVNIEPAAVAEISAHKNIVGIKSSSENVAHLCAIIDTTPEDFSVLVGTASVLYPGLAVGASGGVLALANIAPGECTDIMEFFRTGNSAEALKLQARMIPVNKAVTGKYGVAGLKAAMDMLGYFGGNPRTPLNSLNESQRKDLEKILATAGLLR